MGLRRATAFWRVWAAQAVSVLGDGMHRTAIVWWAASRRGTGAVALLAAYSTVALIVCSPVAGRLADGVSRRAVMAGADMLRVGTSLALAGVVATAGPVWVAAVLTAIAAVGEAAFSPAFTASLATLLPPDELAAGNALNLANGAAGGMLGPAVGGALVAVTGSAGVLALDAASFAVSALIVATTAIPSPFRSAALAATTGAGAVVPVTTGDGAVVPVTTGEGAAVPVTTRDGAAVPVTTGDGAVVPVTTGEGAALAATTGGASVPVTTCDGASPPDDGTSGWALVAGQPTVARILVLVAVLNLVAAPLGVLLVVLVTDHLGGGAGAFGLLDAAFSAGLLVGALAIGLLRRVAMHRAATGALVVAGLAMAAVGAVARQWWAMAALVVVGVALAIANSLLLTMLQLTVPAGQQGRVFGVGGSVTQALRPLGLAAAAPLATGLGAAGGYAVCGLCIAVVSILVRLRAVAAPVEPSAAPDAGQPAV